MFGLSSVYVFIILDRITCLSILAPISVFCRFGSEGPSTFDKLGAGGHELELELVEEFELLGFEGSLLVLEGFRFWKMIVSPFLTPRLSMLQSRSLISKGMGGNPAKAYLALF